MGTLRSQVLVLAALLTASCAGARGSGPPELALHGGLWDLNNDEAVELGGMVDFRPVWRELRPTAGLLVTTNGAVYGGAGVAYPLYLGDRLRLRGHSTLGLYAKGRGSDLGGPVEFRSGVELAGRIAGQWLGLGFAHISNAGLYESNPGSETLYLTWSLGLPGRDPDPSER